MKSGINLKQAAWACSLVAWFLLVQVCGSQDASTFCNSRLRRAKLSQVVENFRHWQEERYFGQDLAVDATIQALRRFRGRELMVLHYVGASGTGKTYLARLVQRSFFTIKQCPKFVKPVNLGSFLDPVIPCPFDEYSPSDLPAFRDACGVGYADLLNGRDTEENIIEVMSSAFDMALTSRLPDEPAIITVDNFNKCKGRCEKIMSDIATQKSYFSTNHKRTFALDNAILLVTSDLSEEGLKLAPTDTRAGALRRIEAAAIKAWGEGSLWNDRAYHAPFVPYTEQELVRITDLTIAEVKEEIRRRIDEELQWRLEQRKAGFGSRMEWVGRFKISEQDKLRLLDRVHQQVANQNARAFEKVRGWLVAASRRPQQIEVVLADKTPLEIELEMPATLRKLWNAFASPTKYYKYTQNIVFKIVDENHVVNVLVEDTTVEPGYHRDEL